MSRNPLIRLGSGYFLRILNSVFSKKCFSAETRAVFKRRNFAREYRRRTFATILLDVIARPANKGAGATEWKHFLLAIQRSHNGNLSIVPLTIHAAYFLSNTPVHIVSFRKTRNTHNKSPAMGTVTHTPQFGDSLTVKAPMFAAPVRAGEWLLLLHICTSGACRHFVTMCWQEDLNNGIRNAAIGVRDAQSE